MEALSQRLATPFNLTTVKRLYGSEVDYVGPLMHPHYDKLVYVYYQPNPKRELGHTEFFGFSILSSDNNRWYVIRLTGEEIEEYQWHTVVFCKECHHMLVSLDRHDYQTCDCNKAMVDGGSRYLRCYAGNTLGKLNTITGEVKVWVDHA
jgi:hypothetical protein